MITFFRRPWGSVVLSATPPPYIVKAYCLLPRRSRGPRGGNFREDPLGALVGTRDTRDTYDTPTVVALCRRYPAGGIASVCEPLPLPEGSHRDDSYAPL